MSCRVVTGLNFQFHLKITAAVTHSLCLTSSVTFSSQLFTVWIPVKQVLSKVAFSDCLQNKIMANPNIVKIYLLQNKLSYTCEVDPHRAGFGDSDLAIPHLSGICLDTVSILPNAFLPLELPRVLFSNLVRIIVQCSIYIFTHPYLE